jgi:hypothetical protein
VVNRYGESWNMSVGFVASQQLSMMKFSRASWVKWLSGEETNISTSTLRTRTEMVFETLVCSPLNHLTRLIALIEICLFAVLKNYDILQQDGLEVTVDTIHMSVIDTWEERKPLLWQTTWKAKFTRLSNNQWNEQQATNVWSTWRKTSQPPS